ncbi:MAG: ABC transporter permease [Thermoanaerobaculia bacterium]
MKLRAIDRKILRDIVHLRGQVLAVAAVVMCGIATFVAMWTAHRSLKLSQEAYYRTHRFPDVFASARRAPDSLARKIAAIEGVAAVRTRIVVDVTLDVPRLEEPATGRLVSIPEHRVPMLSDLFLREGRWVDPMRPDEVIASESFATANALRPGDTVAGVVNGRWRRLEIVGIAISPEFVYEIRNVDIFPDNRRFGVLWIGHEALSNAYDMEDAFNDVAIALAPGGSEREVIARVDDILARWGSTGAYGRDEQIAHRFLSDEIAQSRVSGTVMPAIFLGVAAFLVHMVLTRLVQTQRDQIAVLKAFGYSSLDVALHYLKLAAVVIAIGTVLGIGLGIWLARGMGRLYAEFYHLPTLEFDVDARTLLLAFVISALAASLGALSAVRGALKLPPAEAMRPEAPPVFHPGVLERLGLMKRLPPSGRIIARNLARRRMKAFLSICGVAMAVAILVVGRFMFDAISLMMQRQFSEIQREDVTVSFYEPRSHATRHDLEHLPGVLSVETFRAVPVRFVNEHRSKRAAIFGIDGDGSLRRLIDSKGRAIDVPAEGLAMNATLAEILGVEAGDSLRVEVLEGRRRVDTVRVSRLVDELIGSSVYMDAEALARLTGESRTISGAYLAVDSQRLPELNEQLKRTPAVAGVSLRETVIESFEKTIAQSLTITTTMLILFASVIAVGVVYNGARIALSERGRELASLRVLGFTRGEVSAMLLGEQALLTLLAIPFGGAIGYGFCALIASAMTSELYRIPLVVSSKTWAFAVLVIAAASVGSALLVHRRIRTLDLVEVLKTRE